jgi:hypothetical protein
VRNYSAMAVVTVVALIVVKRLSLNNRLRTILISTKLLSPPSTGLLLSPLHTKSLAPASSLSTSHLSRVTQAIKNT